MHDGSFSNIFLAKGDEYHVFREHSKQQWDSLKSYYTKLSSHLNICWDYLSPFVIFKPFCYGVQMSVENIQGCHYFAGCK